MPGGVSGRRLVPTGAAQQEFRKRRKMEVSPVVSNSAVRDLGLGQKFDKQAVSAVVNRQHLLVGVSNKGTTQSSDGSTFTIDLRQSQLFIPPHAFNVVAKLVDVVVPYTWPNFENDDAAETLTVEIEDEKVYSVSNLTADDYDTLSTETIKAQGDHANDFNGYVYRDEVTSSSVGYSTSDFDDGTFESNDASLPGYDISAATDGTHGNSALNFNLTHNFVHHLVWEEVSAKNQENRIEYIYTCNAFSIIKQLSSSTGLQELRIRFYLQNGDLGTSHGYKEFVLSESLQVSRTNVLTVIFSGANSVHNLSILYNDQPIVSKLNITDDVQSSGSQMNGHVWLASDTDGNNPTTGTTIRLGYLARLSNHVANTMGSLEPGLISDSTSYWYQHAILMKKYKSLSLRPHVKMTVAGLASRSAEDPGEMIEIPLLHDDDETINFSTLPTLLGYMQRVLNQYAFREFYYSNFLSIDLIENQFEAGGTNYLVQFDYNIGRSETVQAFPSAFNLLGSLYGSTGNQMKIDLSPAPFFFYNDDTATGQDPAATDAADAMLKIEFGADTFGDASNTTYFFDATDLANAEGAVRGSSDRGCLILSRSSVARFVYDCIRSVFSEEGYTVPSPWDQRTSQPENSPIESVFENSPLLEGLEQDPVSGPSTELSEGFTIVFKPADEWTDTSGAVPLTQNQMYIVMQNIVPDTTSGDLTGLMTGVYTENSAIAHKSDGTKFETATTTTSSLNIFSAVDTLTLTLTFVDGEYNADSFEVFVNDSLNEYFATSNYGSASASNLFSLETNSYNQEARLGFLTSRSDISLPSKFSVYFPNQTTTSDNAICQMLFGGVVGEMDTSATGVSGFKSEGTGYCYHPFLENVVCNLLEKPTFNIENSIAITVDFSRVDSALNGARHVILPRDETTRIFTLDPYDNGSGDDNLRTVTVDITLPTGSYNPESLTQEINYQLHLADNDLLPDLIDIREISSQQRVQIGALLSSDPNNSYPHSIKFLRNEGNEPTKFASLIGWDLTEGDLVINAPDYRETEVELKYEYTQLLSNIDTFRTRQVFVLADFVNNSTGPDGASKKILASFSPRDEPGETIIFNPNVPILTDVKNQLSDGKMDAIEFKLTDVDFNALAVGASNPWSIQVLIEYQEQIQQSQIQAAARQTYRSSQV